MGPNDTTERKETQYAVFLKFERNIRASLGDMGQDTSKQSQICHLYYHECRYVVFTHKYFLNISIKFFNKNQRTVLLYELITKKG